MDDCWTWRQVNEREWALFKDDHRSRGRVVLSGGRYTGFFDSSPVDRGDDLDEMQWAVEHVVRDKTWLPYVDRSYASGRPLTASVSAGSARRR